MRDHIEQRDRLYETIYGYQKKEKNYGHVDLKGRVFRFEWRLFSFFFAGHIGYTGQVDTVTYWKQNKFASFGINQKKKKKKEEEEEEKE